MSDAIEMTEINTLRERLIDELSELYDAERQLADSLAKISDAARGENLRCSLPNNVKIIRED